MAVPHRTPRQPTAPRKSALAAAALLCTPLATAQQFLVDLGPANLLSGPATTPSPDANGNHWNNLVPGQPIRLVDTAGATAASTSPLGVRLEPLTTFGTSIFDNEGLPAPEPADLGSLAIPSATRDYAFRLSNNGTDIRLRLADLDPAAAFDLEFLGSRSGAASPSITRYTVTSLAGATTIAIDTANNAADLARFEGVQPTPAGTIDIRLDADDGAFMHLNAFRIAVATAGPDITFTQSPRSTIADAGGTLTFTALFASSVAEVAVRWHRDGEPLADSARINGADTLALTIDNATIDDIGEYQLVATAQNADGETIATSPPAAGVVRTSPLGLPDADGNDRLDFFDVLRYLRARDEVSP